MFTFRQFTVNDSRTAMKVGVDSVLLGAWMDLHGAHRLLDAGCGCGLLALMAAQRIADAGGAQQFKIDAVDIVSGAVADAAGNFAASPWGEHLVARRISLQEYADDLSLSCTYDHIFCNPPYYDDSPASASAERDTARSTDTLTRTDLLFAASKLLAPGGRLSLILPFDLGKKMILETTLFGWYLTRQCFVKTKPTGPTKRIMLEFSPAATSRLETETLVIGDERYRELTSPYYL